VSINVKKTLAVAVIGLLGGCASSPHYRADPAIKPVLREEAQAPHYVEPEKTQSSFIILEKPKEEAAPTVPAEAQVDPAITSSADDLYERAKVLMQVTDHPENQQFAVDLLNQAAEMGHAESMRVLGLLALKEGPEQRALAISLLERSAVTSVKAKRQLGILYGNLSAIHLDNTDKAIEYFQGASAMGDGESSLYLSKIMNRLGLAEDAQKWKDIAQEQGVATVGATVQASAQPRAQPSQQDSVMKAYTLQRSAMAGDANSMVDYGSMLLSGQAQGTLMGYEHAQDFEGYYWIRRAATLGNANALEKLDELKPVEAIMAKSNMSYEKLAGMLGAK
jgi:TPR repeat protein